MTSGASRWRRRLRRTVDAALARGTGPPGPGRILLYHRVAEGDPVEHVTPSTFYDHIRAIAESGHVTASVASCARAGFPAGTIGLSFDDGHASVRSSCESLLSHALTMTLFVAPEQIDAAGSLSSAELRELADAGAEVGAHGLRHELLIGSDRGRLIGILSEARARLEDVIGREVVGLAYPFGVASRAAREAAAAAGYRYACTAVPGSNSRGTDPFALRRTEVHGTDLPRDVLGKMAGSDDWFAPIRRLEDLIRYGT